MSLEAKLNRLECHFTWNLGSSKSRFLSLKKILQDIGPEGYIWLGHICNLQGFIHYTLGHRERALESFFKAAETFRQIRNSVSDEGPWLLVNYGDLAWLHFHLGEQAESQSYVTKIEELLETYPSPSQGDLHQEVYAEKAWTFMIGEEHTLNAVELFQKAIQIEPDRAEWHSSHALALNMSSEHSDAMNPSEILEKMRIAKEHDPDNLFLASVYLIRRAETDNVMGEVRELAKQVLKTPLSSYSGIRPLLKLYRLYLTFDEAIDLAQEALERHPNARYLKACLAETYKWKVFSGEDIPRRQTGIVQVA
ncbi:LOW QUALITY PROTEIN: interferon-induced protein with tetratricopeptide repeats 2-like [Aplochiton taeniatus]